MIDVPHGTVNGYRHYACHCAACRAAHADYHRESRARRLTQTIPPHVPHGSTSTYSNWGCRCNDCYEARSADNALYKVRMKARQRQKTTT